MGFKKLRLAPITSFVSLDGYPVYGPFAKLQEASAAIELNSVEMTITNVIKEKTLQADDKEQVVKTVVRTEGILKVYECIAAVAREMFGYAADANGNTIETLNSPDKKRYGAFFEGKTAKGTKYQKYIYDMEFEEMSESFLTDTGEEGTVLEIPFKITFIESDGKVIRAATVYSDKNGFVTGEPTIMYKGVEAVGGLIRLAAPIISEVGDGTTGEISWLPVPNAVSYIVYVNGTQYTTPETTYDVPHVGSSDDNNVVFVLAVGDGATYTNSTFSNVELVSIT